MSDAIAGQKIGIPTEQKQRPRRFMNLSFSG